MSKTIPTAMAARTDGLPNMKLPTRADAAGAADQIADDGRIARVGGRFGSVYDIF